MATPLAVAADYIEALFDLLPIGRWWRKQDRTTRLAKFIAGLSPELARLHNLALSLIEEVDPRTVDQLLANWEEIYGLPDPCVPEMYQPSTLQERREALHARWIATGGQSADYYAAVADALLGVPEGTVEVVELQYLPFRTSISRCGDRLNQAGSQFIWTIKAPASTPAAKRAQLECMINRIKPSHTVAQYEYTL